MQARRLRTTALTALLALAVGAPIQAQEQQQSPAENVPTVDEQELRTYARAYVKVADVRANLQQKLSQASGQEEQAQIRQQANGKMQSILEEHGLTVQRYQEITSVLNNDPAQRSTFTTMVEEIRADQEDDDGDPPGR